MTADHEKLILLNGPEGSMRLPNVVHYPVVHSVTERADDPTELEKMRVNEVVTQIEAIPLGDYWKVRDDEMGRLDNYYGQVASLFGVDMRAIGRTRTQLMRTVMVTSPLWQEDIFESSSQGEKGSGAVFFEKGKRYIPGHPEIVYSATYRPKINDFLRVGFSVLKVQKQDEFGPWEMDYPVFTLPRDVMQKMQTWQESAGNGTDLSKNPILDKGAALISRRVHDWFHSAILYDTNSRSSTFQEWSDDIFFTKHLFDEKGMINYEFLANYTHFLVWQQNFKDDPQTKKDVLKEAENYLAEVGKFADWMKEGGDPDSEKMRISLAYVGVRALFDIIPFDDPDLQSLPMYQEVIALLPEKEQKYLTGLYTFDEKLPFSPSNEKLTVKEIIRKYFQALKDEERVNRLLKQNGHIARDVPDTSMGDVALSQEHRFMPRLIRDQIANLDPVSMDPAGFRLINREFRRIRQEGGQEIAGILGSLVEVDSNGFFYIKVEPGDVNFAESKEVIHTKGALLLQVPEDYPETIELNLVRPTTVLSEHKGASYKVKPGEVIIFNIQNRFYAEKLLKESEGENGEVDVKKFLDLVKGEIKNGISDLSDAYPYEVEKATAAFGLAEKGATRTEAGGKTEIVSGYYQTVGRHRRAVKFDGPVSFVNPSGGRWTIMQGALLEDRAKNGSVDIFPSQGYKFDQNYLGAKWEDLPSFVLSETFLKKVAESAGGKVSLQELQTNMEKLLHALDNANKIKLTGTTPVGLINEAKTFADL